MKKRRWKINNLISDMYIDLMLKGWRTHTGCFPDKLNHSLHKRNYRMEIIIDEKTGKKYLETWIYKPRKEFVNGC